MSVPLEQAVLDCLRQHGPMSADQVVGKIRRRRGDVLRALRSLRDCEKVQTSRARGDGRGTGYLKLWRAVESEPTRPKRKRARRDVPNCVLEDIAAGRVDGADWARRELERRRAA